MGHNSGYRRDEMQAAALSEAFVNAKVGLKMFRLFKTKSNLGNLELWFATSGEQGK